MATALLVVLATGLVSLLVLAVTFRLTRANEHHKWLREKRFEVYAELLAAIEEARHRSAQKQEELDSALLRYETAFDAALLLAGPSVSDALHNWVALTKANQGKLWHQRPYSEISRCYDQVLNSMDLELGVQ